MKLTLKDITEKLTDIRGNLDLRGCTGLTSLPDGLTVGGWLDLQGCTSLVSLPDAFNPQGGWVDLSGCTSLVSLPDAFNPQGGGVYLSGCTSLAGAVHGCGQENRTVCAYGSPRVVSLGCFVCTENECIAAIREKYGDTTEAAEYIGKVKLAFSM